MGFRVRRSIKLMPGIRMNLSGGGASLSLGGRGATLNISSRGTRTTVGIPGTGLLYTSSSSSASGYRRPSTTQLAAQHRRLLQEQDRAHALGEIERMEAELKDTLNVWRESLVVTPPHAVRSGLAARPFEPPEAPPSAPDYDALGRPCLVNAIIAVRKEQPMALSDRLLVV